MFLLIRAYKCYKARLAEFTFQYVSINTIFAPFSSVPCSSFTFQYVSINTTIAFNSTDT